MSIQEVVQLRIINATIHKATSVFQVPHSWEIYRIPQNPIYRQCSHGQLRNEAMLNPIKGLGSIRGIFGPMSKISFTLSNYRFVIWALGFLPALSWPRASIPNVNIAELTAIVPFVKREVEVPPVCRGWHPVSRMKGSWRLRSIPGISRCFNTHLWPRFRCRRVASVLLYRPDTDRLPICLKFQSFHSWRRRLNGLILQQSSCTSISSVYL